MPAENATSALRTDEPWWRTATIYQVYIRSFADGDGDGVGDLAGIRSRLPYLHDLGVDAIWVTPFYPSPMADGGYDVADYRDVEPLFGTLAEAQALVEQAHALDLKVMVDIVPNHTSDRHAWFQAALAAAPGSPERARYLFRPGKGSDGSEPPTDWRSVFGGPGWKQVPDGEWFLHLFAPEQPDLDWENPEVVGDFHDTLRFWLDRGVDGFRIDVANSLKKDQSFPDLGDADQGSSVHPVGPHHPFWDRDEVHEVYRGWRKVSEEYAGDRAFVAEAWVDDPERLARYARPDELHTAFNFAFLRSAWDAAELRTTIDTCLAAAAGVGAPTTWVLSNHDVTRHATRYARLDSTGGGVADEERVTQQTPVDPELGLRRARAATLLMLALPGSAYLYQGEELGLPEVLDLPESVLADPIWERSGHRVRGRDGCRVPVPWTVDGPSLGFGSGEPWLPQPADWAGASGMSVQAQAGTEGSTLELYRSALACRRDLAVDPVGTPVDWRPSDDGTLVIQRLLRSLDGGPEGGPAAAVVASMVCVVNVSGAAVALPAYDEVLVASGPVEDGKLPVDTAVWLRTSC